MATNALAVEGYLNVSYGGICAHQGFWCRHSDCSLTVANDEMSVSATLELVLMAVESLTEIMLLLTAMADVFCSGGCCCDLEDGVLWLLLWWLCRLQNL
jgi:hypothetical protein